MQDQNDRQDDQIYRPNKYLFYTYLTIGILFCLTIIFIPIGLILIFVAFLQYKFSYIIIGENGVELRKGWLNVTHKQVPYSKINTVEAQISLIDRLFKTGKIRIFTGNDVQGITFFGINSPGEIKELIEMRSQKTAINNANHNIQPTYSSTAEEIAKFADLKSKGVITQEEFDAKKRQLLG